MRLAEPIILASSSPRRIRMFEELKIPFEVIPARIDEKMNNGEQPEEFAKRAAEEKGRAVAGRLQNEGRAPWIVAADTIVVLDAEVLFKPIDGEDACSMLKKLAGRTHKVITGWTVGRADARWIIEHTETKVTFHSLTDEQMQSYVASGDGMDKAGAYAIQGLGSFLVDRVDGNYFNVVGLPISYVIRTLVEIGALPAFPMQ
jgi:septum formation protein